MGTEIPTYRDWQDTRRWILVERNKTPAAGWIHPRPNHRRERQVNQRTYKVTSTTPGSWLTWAESVAVMGVDRTRHLYPAYVYSGQNAEDNANPHVNFLDIDAHPENNPEGHDAAKWRDDVVDLFLDAVPDLRPVNSVSGTGQHLVFAMDPTERPQWESLEKIEEKPYWSVGPNGKFLGAAKLEMWNAWAGGRYQLFTGKYDGQAPALDDAIPLLPFPTFIALLEQIPDRYTNTEGKVYGAANNSGHQDYPSGAEYARSELGHAYRLAYSEAAANRHMIVISEGKVYIIDAQGVGHDLGTNRGRSVAGARLFEINHEIAVRLARMGPGFGETFQNFVDGFRMNALTGIISRILTFPESDAFNGLVRYRDSDAGARLTSSSLNLDYIGGTRRPWIIGADGMVRDIASGNPLEFAAVVRRRITSDRTPLKVGHVEGALDQDNNGARYVRAISEAWGESLRLVAWLMLAPRKTAGIVLGPWDVGKSLLFSGLQAAGLASMFDDDVPSRLRARGRRSHFDYLAKALTEVTLAVVDDVPTVEASEAIEISVTGIKTVVGSTTLGYEAKGEDRVNPRRQGSLLITCNEPGPLLNTANPALRNKLLFICPPHHHPLLDSSAGGMDPDLLFTPDAQAALVDLMLREMRGVITWKGPRFDMQNLTASQQTYHNETLIEVGSGYLQYKDEQKAKSKKG